MKKAILRNAVLPVVLAGSFIALDLLLDRHFGAFGRLDWPHLVLASSIVLISYFLMNRAVDAARRAEVAQREALDALESRVVERTAQLEQANQALQAEVVERKRIEQALRTSEETARALMNALSESAILFDTEGIVLASNATAARRLGATVEGLVGSPLFDFFPPEVGERRRPLLDRILTTAQPVHFVDERAGRTYENHVYPICDSEGRIIRIAAFGMDITERKRAEADIQHLSSFPRLNPNPVLEVDASGAITFHNPAVAETLEKLGLADDARAFLPDDMATILEELHQERESRFQREVQVGSRIFAESIHVIPASNVVRLYGFEVTKRVRAQEALLASEEKYRLLFQNMAEGFALYELLYDEQGQPADWRVLEVNDAYPRHTGIARDQIVGRRISELFPAAIPEYLPRFAAVVATQTPTEFETYAQAVGRHQRVSIFPAGGRRFAGIIEDITRRKQSEEAFREAQAELAQDMQKRSALEERQRLARELHDSVSQALYGVSLGVHSALAQLDADRAKTREALDFALSLAHAGLTEMRALIFELRPESLEREGLVAALTKQVEALRARHHIEVEVSLCDEPDVPLPVKEAFYRIAQEALQNAVKHAQPGRLEVSLMCADGGLVLEVRDNGAGFDPTAEYPGHLGLHSMRERAQNLGGTFEIISERDCGTQIQVCIPI